MESATQIDLQIPAKNNVSLRKPLLNNVYPNYNSERRAMRIYDRLDDSSVRDLFSRLANIIREQAEEWRTMHFFQRQKINSLFNSATVLSIPEYIMHLEKMGELDSTGCNNIQKQKELERHFEPSIDWLHRNEIALQEKPARTEVMSGWF